MVNAAETAGVAGLTSDALEALGYLDVGTFDGEEVFDVSVVFAAEGFQGPADRVAAEVGVAPGRVFPIDAIPFVFGLDDSPVVVYLGRDVRTLAILS